MSKQKHILYIVPRFYPFKGGAERNILAMAERIVNKGYRVTVFTARVSFDSKKPPLQEVYKGMTIHRFRALNEALNVGFYPGLLPALLRVSPDVIHVSGFGFVWIEFCLLIKRITSRKWQGINTPHGPFLAFAHKGPRLWVKKIWTAVWLRPLIKRLYDKVIAVVDKQREWMTDEYGIPEDRINTIHNGIDASYISRTEKIIDPGARMEITYLNRLEEYKGVQQVLHALHLLQQRNSNMSTLHFHIMGRPGGYTQALKKLVTKYALENQVTFTVSPDDKTRDEAFSQSQINILPSRWEGTGIALIEAMAQGNVIITTYQNQAVDELIIPEQTGFAYDFDDVEKLAAILERLLNDPVLRQKIITHNMSFAKQWTWEAEFDKYLDMIEAITLKKQKEE